MIHIKPNIYIHHLGDARGIIWRGDVTKPILTRDLSFDDLKDIDLEVCIINPDIDQDLSSCTYIISSKCDIDDDELTHIYLLSLIKAIKHHYSYQALLNFHTTNKYLLMSYHQKDLTHLGQILANPLKKTDEEVITAYENSLIATLRKKSTKQNRINVYAHIYGYFKKVIDENLKNEFFNLLELYQDSKISHIELLEFLWNLTNRFHEPYLLKQTIFNPYPIALKRAIERLIKKTVTTG